MPPQPPKTYKFNPYAKLASMRLTPDEERALFHVLLDKVEPEDEQAPFPLIALVETLAEAKSLILAPGQISGLSTGYRELDEMTGGMGPGDLIVVAGDTHHGKSQLSQNIIYRVAKAGHAVGLVGLEMVGARNTVRFLSLGDEEEVAGLPIVYPRGLPTVLDLERLFEAFVANQIELVVIDQLQNLVRGVENAVTELSVATQMIKRLAITYRLPVMLLSHISRNGAEAGFPGIHALKGSGSIEQDADMILMVRRDMEDLMAPATELHVKLLKNRNHGLNKILTKLNIEGLKLIDPLEAIHNVFPGSHITPPPQRLL